MGRRLAEATKAWRARRTRGETGLWRFRAPPLFAVVLEGVFLADFAADFAVEVLVEDLAAVPLPACLAGAVEDSDAGADEDDVAADGAV
jgi:hypothetical protein